MSWREWLGFKPRIEDLAARVIALAERAGVPGWRYDREQQLLKHEASGTLNLTNIFLEYAQAPRGARAALASKYAAMAAAIGTEVPGLWTLASKNVYAVLRSAVDYALLRLQASADQPSYSAPHWPWCGDLEIRLVYDFGPHVSHVTDTQIETWGQPAEAVRERALRNLSVLARPRWQSLGGGVHQLVSDVAYEESFLLVDAAFEPLPFKDHLACVISNRGVLLATDRRDEQALANLLTIAQRFMMERPWPLSATVLAREDGQWRELTPTGVARKPADNLRRLSLHSAYQAQKAVLEKAQDGDEAAPYVAEYNLMQRQEDPRDLRAFCTWGKGVDTLIPRTDLVALVRGEGPQDMIMVPWDDLRRTCDAYLASTDLVPERFRVTRFPDDAAWATLRAFAITT